MSNEETQNNSANDNNNFDPDNLDQSSTSIFDEPLVDGSKDNQNYGSNDNENNLDNSSEEASDEDELDDINDNDNDTDDEIEDELDDELDDDLNDENPEDEPMKHSGSKYLSKYPTRILVGVLLVAAAIIIFALADVDNKKKNSDTDMSKVNIGDNSMFANAINDSASSNGIIPEKTTLNDSDNTNNSTNNLGTKDDNGAASASSNNSNSNNKKPNTVLQPYNPKLELVDPNANNEQYSQVNGPTNQSSLRYVSQFEQQREREILAIRQQKIGLFTNSVNSPSKIAHNFKELKSSTSISGSIYSSNASNGYIYSNNDYSSNSYVSSNGGSHDSVYASDTSAKLEYIQNERNRINAMLQDGTNNRFQQTLASLKNSGGSFGGNEGGVSGVGGSGFDSNDLSLSVVSQNPDGSIQSTIASSNGTTSGKWELSSSVQIPKKYSVMTGSVIPATLITGINSDLPGQIIAQVSQNVYDSPTGRYMLIPQGTRIIGTYDNGIIFGQERVLVSWNRLVFLDGKNIDIGSMNAADQSGYAGVSDQVNNHYLRLFGSSLLLSVISAGVTYSQDKYAKNNNGSETTASGAMAQSLGNQMGQTTMQVIQKHMNVSPTLEIRPGFRLNVMVTKDILFSKPYMNYDY